MNEDLNKLALASGATHFTTPPMRAVTGWSFTYEALGKFVQALADPEGPQVACWISAQDVLRSALTIDRCLNGEGGATRPLLIDVTAQIEAEVRRIGRPLLQPPKPPRQRDDQEPDGEWAYALAISDRLDVDVALRGFMEDPTEDNAVCAVREVIRAVAPDGAAERADRYATEINRLRNVIQSACIGGVPAMIERWKELFPDASVPTVSRADQDAMDAADANSLAWAVSRWRAEVQDRPEDNVHRRSLDATWRQVIKHFGGDPEKLVGAVAHG